MKLIEPLFAGGPLVSSLKATDLGVGLKVCGWRILEHVDCLTGVWTSKLFYHLTTWAKDQHVCFWTFLWTQNKMIGLFKLLVLQYIPPIAKFLIKNKEWWRYHV